MTKRGKNAPRQAPKRVQLGTWDGWEYSSGLNFVHRRRAENAAPRVWVVYCGLNAWKGTPEATVAAEDQRWADFAAGKRADGHYRVTITFDLLEDVTPELFAQKVALACANYGAIRVGEGVVSPTLPDLSYRRMPDLPVDQQTSLTWLAKFPRVEMHP